MAYGTCTRTVDTVQCTVQVCSSTVHVLVHTVYGMQEFAEIIMDHMVLETVQVQYSCTCTAVLYYCRYIVL